MTMMIESYNRDSQVEELVYDYIVVTSREHNKVS